MATSSKRKSLVARLWLRGGLWALVLVATLVSLAAWQYHRASLQMLDAALTAEARVLSTHVGEEDGLVDVAVPGELRQRLAAEASYYGVFDADGRHLDGDAASSGRAGVRTAGGNREVLIAGPRGTTVLVGRSLASRGADTRRVVASLLGAGGLVLLLALPLSVWFRRQLAGPLADIDRTARALVSGRPARVETASLDIEFAGVATALNAAFDRLQDSIERERRLTADVSHELRTPVAALMAETGWALDRPRSVEEYQRALAVCGRQARRMRDLTDGLLVLARIEGGGAVPERQAIELRAVADAAIEALAAVACDRGVTVAVEGHAAVFGDRVQLGTLLSNLLSNAIRYNHPGGHVFVRIGDTGATAHLEVEDTGGGLHPGQMARVFDRFWRADPARSSRDGGAGLGLAISKAVVTAHDGTISCHRAPGGGALFRVDLPARTPDSGDWLPAH